MKRFLLAASALVAIPAIAAAQPYDNSNDRDRKGRASQLGSSRAAFASGSSRRAAGLSRLRSSQRGRAQLRTRQL